jgi:hypothetical protein
MREIVGNFVYQKIKKQITDFNKNKFALLLNNLKKIYFKTLNFN